MLKVGFWQICELLTVIYSLYSGFMNHGKIVMTVEAYAKYKAQSDEVKNIGSFIIFLLYMALGPVIAYNGGCVGVYLLAYSGACFLTYLYGMNLLNSGKCLNMKRNFYQSALTMAGYNVLLYLGGFWTVTQ